MKVKTSNTYLSKNDTLNLSYTGKNLYYDKLNFQSLGSAVPENCSNSKETTPHALSHLGCGFYNYLMEVACHLDFLIHNSGELFNWQLLVRNMDKSIARSLLLHNIYVKYVVAYHLGIQVSEDKLQTHTIINLSCTFNCFTSPMSTDPYSQAFCRLMKPDLDLKTISNNFTPILVKDTTEESKLNYLEPPPCTMRKKISRLEY